MKGPKSPNSLCSYTRGFAPCARPRRSHGPSEPRCPEQHHLGARRGLGTKGTFLQAPNCVHFVFHLLEGNHLFSLKGKKRSIYFARTKRRVYRTVRNTNYFDSYPLFSIFLRTYVISFRTYQYLCPVQELSRSLFSINAERLEPPFALFCTWGIPAAVCVSAGARGSESRALKEERSPLSAPKPFPRPGAFPSPTAACLDGERFFPLPSPRDFSGRPSPLSHSKEQKDKMRAPCPLQPAASSRHGAVTPTAMPRRVPRAAG